MKRLLNAMVVVMVFLAGEVAAQDTKERGNTDQTNNRSRGKEQNDNVVNTKKKTPVKIIEYLPGVWNIEKVLKGKQDVTKSDTLAQGQTIEFTREARFVMYSDNAKIDSGMYRVNEQQAILYMASETGESPVEWNVGFDPKGTMTLRMRDGGAHGQDFAFVYRRESNSASRK